MAAVMDRFTLRLAGDVSPERVALGTLADVLTHLDDLISAYADAWEPESPDAPKISLVGIRSGSAMCDLVVRGPIASVVSDVRRAADDRDWGRLPERARRELYSLSRLGVRNGWSVQFLIGPDPDHPIEMVALDDDIPPPGVSAVLRGTTTLLGQCIRVGGAKEKIDIRAFSDGRIHHLSCDRDAALAAAPRLYETVVIEVEATFDAVTGAVIDYERALRLTAYRQTDVSTAFAELARASGNAWDGVDAAVYVRSLRGDDA